MKKEVKDRSIRDTSKELENLTPEARAYIEGYVAGLEHQIRKEEKAD